MDRGRPTKEEIEEFFSLCSSEDDYYVKYLSIIREDRSGIFARQKEIRSNWRKKKMLSSASLRVENSTRARIYVALKGKAKGKLIDGMSWDNYGKWHIDHIEPCSMFNQDNVDEFNECWGLGNLQPLWASDNIKRGAKYGKA